MVILTAPFLSINARGQFGKAMVYLGWKGLKTGRAYVVPANPRTAAQITQRGYVTSIVSAWKNYFTNATGRAAWNRSALNDSRPLSGFNMFSSQAIQMIAITADASFNANCVPLAGQVLVFTTLNLDDGAQGDEAGNFEIWSGSTISGMTLSEEVAIAGGDVLGTIDQGDPGDIVYCKIRKDSFDRSGIFAITLF